MEEKKSFIYSFIEYFDKEYKKLSNKLKDEIESDNLFQYLMFQEKAIKGSLYALSGNPSSGKTSLIINLINNLSIEKRINKTALFSLQNSNNTIAEYIFSVNSKIPFRKIQNQYMRSGEIITFQETANKIFSAEEEGYFYICEKNVLTISELEKEMKEIKEKNNTEIFFIDGMHFIKPEMKYTSFWEMINDCAINLKRIALNLDAAVFVTINSLRSSSDTTEYIGTVENNIAPVGISYNSDVIINISNHSNEFEEISKKIIKIEKNNYGPVIKREIYFYQANNSFIIPKDNEESK